MVEDDIGGHRRNTLAPQVIKTEPKEKKQTPGFPPRLSWIDINQQEEVERSRELSPHSQKQEGRKRIVETYRGPRYVNNEATRVNDKEVNCHLVRVAPFSDPFQMLLPHWFSLHRIVDEKDEKPTSGLR